MAKRKKRLKKGIESINKQIELHKKKREKAEQDGKIELVGYYNKEIENLEETKEEKENLLEKQ